MDSVATPVFPPWDSDETTQQVAEEAIRLLGKAECAENWLRAAQVLMLARQVDLLDRIARRIH